MHKNMKLEDRYQRNLGALTEEDMLKIRQAKVCVVGCGGLGGHIAEMLVRIGIGEITIIDGDVFVESNLNRQLYATEKTLGRNKADVAAEYLKEINSKAKINTIVEFIDEVNISMFLDGYDLVFDALDNIDARLLLENACEDLEIVLVHGAIGGWYAQVGVIFPGDGLLKEIYKADEKCVGESELGNPSFTPALAASIEVSEGIKVLLGNPDILRHRLLAIDLLRLEFEMIQIGNY